MSLWQLMGRTAYEITKPGIRLVVNNSHRTRVLITCGDEYLLVKHWMGHGGWTLPGGGLHKAEDIFLGALREVKEEVSVVLNKTSLEHHGNFEVQKEGFRFRYELFVAGLASKPQVRVQRIEILEARWFRLPDVPPGRLSPEVTEALRVWQR